MSRQAASNRIHTGCPKKMYHICFVYSFYSFQLSQLRPTSKDSQFHGDLLTLPMYSVASSWLSLWHVLEVSVFLGHTALLGVWPPRPNIRLGKSREWPQGSPVSSSQGFWCSLVLQVPHKKNQERWNPANMVASSQRRKGRKRQDPLKRSCSQARLLRDVRVWVAGPSSWNDCWLSAPAHFEFRARKKRLSTAMYRRVMTVTVSPATFKSERWLQARLRRTRGLKNNARLAHLTRQ